MYCKACGAVANEKAAKFCSACGATLAATEGTTESSIWKLSVSRKFGAIIIAILLAIALYFFVVGAMYPTPNSPHRSEVSGFMVWSGILAAILAKKKRWLWFFLGMVISVPLVFLARGLGSLLR